MVKLWISLDGMCVVSTTVNASVTMTGTRAAADVAREASEACSTAVSSMKAASRARSAGARNIVVPPTCHQVMSDTRLASAVTRSPLPSGAWPSSVVMIGFMSMLSIRASS